MSDNCIDRYTVYPDNKNHPTHQISEKKRTRNVKNVKKMLLPWNHILNVYISYTKGIYLKNILELSLCHNLLDIANYDWC